MIPVSRRFLLQGAGSLAAMTAFGLPLSARAAGVARHAFICGNSAYARIPVLPNPRADAAAIGKAVATTGFRLFEGKVQTDRTQDAMRSAIDRFATGLQPDGVGLFYFAGHGFQIGRTNYLTGIDATDDPGGNVDASYLPLSEVFAALDASKAALNIVVLDACRDNPFAGQVAEGGLARVDAPTRTLISYSTQPGNVAMDGADGSSPYAAALAEAMTAPGATVLEVFNNTGLSVEAVTKGKQVPWVSLSPIPSRLAFSEALTPAAAPAPARAPACGENASDMAAPITGLFRAWERLDIGLYEKQWARDAFQVAGKIQRKRRDIVAARRKLMGRLKKVEVVATAPVLEAREGDVAFFSNVYTMNFHLKTGRVIREVNVAEAYTVACRDGAWRVKENFDYVDRSAVAAKAARRARGG